MKRRGPQLSGADYLAGVAAQAAERGQPFADYFARMVTSAVMPDPLLLMEGIANRPLKAHEASPVAIIVSAVQLALSRRDDQGAEEALTMGAALLAKWPEYLAAGEVHPTLVWAE